MFEGRIKPTGKLTDEEGRILRELRWTDLVAKLEATRELRDTSEQPCEVSSASFSSLRPGGVSQSERVVNHDALSHGKTKEVSGEPNADNSQKGDREEI